MEKEICFKDEKRLKFPTLESNLNLQKHIAAFFVIKIKITVVLLFTND
jgi:hypothetical protein